MVDVQTEIYIGVPRATVAAYASEPGNAPQWYGYIDSARWLSAPPLQIGSRMAFSARFLGRSLDYSYDVVELVPGERLVMQTSQGPFPMRTSYSWRDVGNGTHMTLRNDGEPRGFSVVAGALMAPMMRRAWAPARIVMKPGVSRFSATRKGDIGRCWSSIWMPSSVKEISIS